MLIRRFHSLPLLLVALALFATMGCGQGRGTRGLTAEQIVVRMSAVYAECKTYSDTGNVVIDIDSDIGKTTANIRFATAMIRPNHFRFEYSNTAHSNSRHVIWRNGNDVRSWWGVTQKSERNRSLLSELASATAASFSSAYTIPALLMPREVGILQLTDLEGPKRGDDKTIGDHACFTIEAKLSGSSVTIWIDQENFSVRRIEEFTQFDSMTTDQTTNYEPVFDENVAPELLEYNAPG